MMTSEEINNWQNNSPFLYSCLITYTLEWPSLSVQFLDKPLWASSNHSTTQTLLIGTHVSQGEQNEIIFLDVTLPQQDMLPENRIFLQHEDYAGFAYGEMNCAKFRVRHRVLHPFGEPNRIQAMPQDQRVVASISVEGAEQSRYSS